MKRVWSEVKAEISASFDAQRTALLAQSDCSHTLEYRKYRISNGAETLRQQCTTCGELIGGALKRETVSNFNQLPEVDTELRERRQNRWRDVNNFEARNELLNEKFWQLYEEHLRSPEWRQKRALVLRRAAGRREGCGLNPPAHVHHRSYENLGNEFLFELVAICQECHQRIHPHRDLVM